MQYIPGDTFSCHVQLDLLRRPDDRRNSGKGEVSRYCTIFGTDLCRQIADQLRQGTWGPTRLLTQRQHQRFWAGVGTPLHRVCRAHVFFGVKVAPQTGFEFRKKKGSAVQTAMDCG